MTADNSAPAGGAAAVGGTGAAGGTAAADRGAPVRYVEKPPHIDPDRMRHISDAALLAAFDGLDVVDVAGLRRHFAQRSDRRPVWDPARWAAAAGESARAETVEAADALLELQVDFTDASRGKSVFYGFHYLGWMTPLVRAYALTGERRYAEAFGRLIGQWYATRDAVVGDWPGLDVIWYSLGITSRSSVMHGALAVLAGEPALADEQWTQMLKAVVGGARWSAEEHDEFRHGNWQLVCAAELLHAGAMLPEFSESAEWITLAQQRLVDHLDRDVYEDGGHYERSPSYHTMCLNAYQRAAVIGEQYLGWPLAEHPRFKAMYDWLLLMSAPSGYAIPFQDSGLIWSGVELLKGYYFFGDPAYKAVAERWLSPERIEHELAVLPIRPGRRRPSEEFASGLAAEPTTASTLLPTSRYAVMRTGWDSADLLTVVNYGPYVGHELEPHSHHAALDFVITGWGEALAWEAGGPPSYDDPGYYDWFQATRGHNTVVLPGVDFVEDRRARLLAFRATPIADVFVGEHHGYSRPHRRRIVFSRTGPRYWLITDEIGGGAPAHWLLHGRTPWIPAPAGFGPLSHLSAEGPGLLAIPVHPDRVTGVTMSAGPSRIPARSSGGGSAFGPVTAGGNGFDEIHTLAFGFECGEPFSVLIVPLSATDRGALLSGPPPVRVSEADGVVEVSSADTLDRIGQHRWQRTSADRPDPLVVRWEDQQ